MHKQVGTSSKTSSPLENAEAASDALKSCMKSQQINEMCTETEIISKLSRQEIKSKVLIFHLLPTLMFEVLETRRLIRTPSVLQ